MVLKENKRNFTLDFIRGVSALLVLSGHLRSVLFKDFSELGSNYESSIIEEGFYFITSLGHQAVMIFFVLSGFFVGGSALKAKNSFNFKNYLVNRLSRLWTPLVPILILTFIIDYFIGVYSIGILNGTHFSTLMSGPSGDYSASPSTFISNILFLQTVFTPVYGSNGPLWSLANEFWYYILFPLVMFVSGLITQNGLKRLIYGIISLLLIVFILPGMMQGFLIWLMGVLVYLINEKKAFAFNLWGFILSMILFVTSIVGAKLNIFGSFYYAYSDVFIGFAFSVFLVTVINMSLPNLPFLNVRKISFWISEISYTLYISHFPLVLLIYGLYYSDNQIVFGWFSLLQYFAWLILLVIISIGLWSLFERKTPFVRKKLMNLVEGI